MTDLHDGSLVFSNHSAQGAQLVDALGQRAGVATGKDLAHVADKGGDVLEGVLALAAHHLQRVQQAQVLDVPLHALAPPAQQLQRNNHCAHCRRSIQRADLGSVGLDGRRRVG